MAKFSQKIKIVQRNYIKKSNSFLYFCEVYDQRNSIIWFSFSFFSIFWIEKIKIDISIFFIEKKISLFDKIIFFDTNFCCCCMAQNISNKPDNLFKSKIFLSKFLFYKCFKCFIVFQKFSHNSKDTPKWANLNKISKNIFLFRVLVYLFEQCFHQRRSNSKMRLFSSNNSNIQNFFWIIIALNQKFQIFPKRKKSVITLQKFDIGVHENENSL